MKSWGVEICWYSLAKPEEDGQHLPGWHVSKLRGGCGAIVYHTVPARPTSMCTALHPWQEEQSVLIRYHLIQSVPIGQFHRKFLRGLALPNVHITMSAFSIDKNIWSNLLCSKWQAWLFLMYVI